ncbi:hypothetical protein H2248_001536 [Termitomyces sp. 'cryptogamus']|nr:hypothetical protein H2248_001536 [Termitomyces sp. 'cryptogamus']
MTGPLTLPLAPPVSQKKRQRQMQENARTLLPLSSVQPVSGNMIRLSVHLFEDPDPPSHSTWVVQRDSENTFTVELWNDGYTFWQEDGSWVFIGKQRVLTWETLEPFTAGHGREAKPLRIYRRPTTRIDFLFGKGLSCLMYLIAVVLLLWQPWKTDINSSLRGFFSNSLPMLAQWWWRIERRPGERTIDPFLNSFYSFNPCIFM